MPDIYSYGDYRKFLADVYAERKAADHAFSFQRLAAAAGFNTKTFLYKVIKGEKALSGPSIPRVARALELGKAEARFFRALVAFNEGRSVQERERSFALLRSFKYTHTQVRLRANQFTYFSKWHYAVVRELVTILEFGEDYQLLARAVVPAIKPHQARSAVRFLLTMGFVRRDASGRYHQTRANLTTGDEVVSTAVQRFQKDTMVLASQAIDRFPRDMRDISTLTMGLSAEGFEAVKRDLQNYRKHLVGIAQQDRKAGKVYQLNMQFFPVSTIPRPRKRRKGAA